MINFIRTLLLVTYIKLVAQVFVMYVTIVIIIIIIIIIII